ncbi:insulinase family protein [Candidatus Marsarchaeota archaeon]|nr:insulinase family protein [Candidatus Marsarchaeota archaeon]
MSTILKTLPNGLQVIAVEVPGLQSIGIAAGVKYGSIDENPRINGSAHFLEHMLYKGTKKRTWQDISNEARSLGAYQNAMTDFEATIFMIQSFKGDIAKAMALFSDIIKNSSIPEKEFDLERGPIMNENLMDLDNPMRFVSDFIPRAIYKKNPARMPVGGDNEKTVKNIRRSDLVDIYENYYTPKNMLLVVYGGVSAAKSFAVAKRWFSDFDRKYVPKQRKIINETQVKTKISEKRPGLKSTLIGIGLKCNEFDPKKTEEHASLEIISEILSNNLFDEIREKKGLSYFSTAGYNQYSTFSFLSAFSNTKPENKNEVINIMLETLEKMQNGKISEDELKRAKKGIIVPYMLSKEKSLSSAVAIANDKLLFNDPFMSQKIMKFVNQAPLSQIKKHSAKFINTSAYGLAVIEPK